MCLTSCESLLWRRPRSLPRLPHRHHRLKGDIVKVDTVYFLIAVAAGLVLSYGLWSIAGELSAFIAIGSMVYLCSTLGMMIGVRHEYSRTRTNLGVLSGVFFVIGVSINVAFSYAGYAPVFYILVSSLSFLAYLLLANFILNAKQ